MGFSGQRMKRAEAVALLKELGTEQLIQPSLVLIEQRKPDRFQLQLKGDFSCNQIEAFLKSRGFSCTENKDVLTIFKP